MKIIIFYVLSFMIISASAIQPSFDRIVIKLRTNNHTIGTKSNDSNTLDAIAIGLNSNISNLFHIPLLPFNRTVNNNSLSGEMLELKKYRTIPLDGDLTKDEILQAVEKIKLLNNVDVVYAQPIAKLGYVDSSKLPQGNVISTPSVGYLGNFLPYQGYLNPAPQGIDAKYAWTIRGGHGRSIKVVDVEGAWNRTHHDLPSMFASMGGDYNSVEWFNHGTAVEGIVSGVDNEFGILGIASEAKFGSANVFSSLGTADAIRQAADAVGNGGVIIIEVQYGGGPEVAVCSCNEVQCNLVPAEYYLAEFDAIKYATAKGVTVVEAAGNGSVDFDHTAYNNKFNRAYRDSGAILVAASTSTARTPACFTNYGNRIDIHGWGMNVTTTGYGDLYSSGGVNQEYTSSFSGTSSAAPIVAGAVASLQGIAKQKLGRFLTPHEVRDILTHTATPQSGGFNKKIAGLPNLRKAINNVLKLNIKKADYSWMVPAIYYPMLLSQ